MITREQNEIPTIDRWILGTMRDRDQLFRRLTIEPSEQRKFEDTVRAARSALRDPGHFSAKAIRQFFGSPDSHDATHLVYRLRLWPEHTYEWTITPAGLVTNAAFKRRRSLNLSKERAPLLSTQAFEPWLDTESDVRKALGEPVREEGWWPERDLFYFSAPDGPTIVFSFCHGLLIEATRRPEV